MALSQLSSREKSDPALHYLRRYHWALARAGLHAHVRSRGSLSQASSLALARISDHPDWISTDVGPPRQVSAPVGLSASTSSTAVLSLGFAFFDGSVYFLHLLHSYFFGSSTFCNEKQHV